MPSTDNSILVITGPTASGKTDHALQLAADDASIEIVNADASLLFRGFDIGTAKPPRELRERIPHHLIDILEPDQHFTASEYSDRARKAIREIVARGKQPVVVGGTGFYIDALFKGILKVEIDPEVMRSVKARIMQEVADLGFDEMHRRLKPIDPALFDQINRERNPLRLYRAWEHYYATGQPLGEARKELPLEFEFSPDFKVLDLPRPELWQRIERRVDQMLASGWLAEAKELMQQGITREMPAMKAIGYRELFDVLEGTLSPGAAREQIIIRTRQYAKRQVTWMKRYQTSTQP